LAQIPLRRRELLILDTSKIWKFLELMPRLTDSVTHAGLADRVFGENELRDVLGGRDARRYGLVNRALKDGSLRRLKRGVYVLNSRYRKEPLHPFAVAQSLHPGSYVSFETALSYHGWIQKPSLPPPA
jgi:predicted transcriptional regulator of viral defense system